MPKCQFTTKYYNYEIGKYGDFNCQEEESLASGFCIFHDKDYLQDKTNYEEHKRKVLNRLKDKVNDAISNKKPLFCIGFQLPDFNLSDLSNSKEFTKSVYFINDSQFFGKVDFSGAHFKRGAHFIGVNFEGEADFSPAKFEGKADFSGAKFQGEAVFGGTNFQGGAYFSGAKFQGEAYFSGEFNSETIFHYVLFEGKKKVIFEIENLSNVSFMNTDLTEVRFSDKARWGGEGKKVKDRFKVLDGRQLEEKIKENDGHIKRSQFRQHQSCIPKS